MPTYKDVGGTPFLSPEQVASRRKMAQAMIGKGTDTSPVGHWTQALARVVQGGIGGMSQDAADLGENEGRQAARRSTNAALVKALTNKAPPADVATGLMGDDNPWSDGPEMGQKLALSELTKPKVDPLAEYKANAAKAEAAGYQRGSPEWKHYSLTGNLPSAKASAPNVTEVFDEATGQPRKVIIGPDGSMQPIGGVRAPEKREAGLSVIEKKQVFDSEDALPALDATVGALERAKELNAQTFEGMTSGLRGSLGTAFSPGSVPGQLMGGIVDRGAAEATNEWGKLMNMEAIQSMAATLKGATTNFELQEFVKVLADPSTPPPIRERTIERMMTLAKQRRQTARDRIKELRAGPLRPGQQETVNPQTGEPVQPNANTIDLGDGFSLEFSQ
jgi:hypothetical protein